MFRQATLRRGPTQITSLPQRATSRAEELLDFAGLEPDEGLTVYDSDRRGHPSKLLQLLHRGFVRRDVSLRKGDQLPAKELLQPVAEQSPGLRVDGHRLRHSQLLPYTNHPM